MESKVRSGVESFYSGAARDPKAELCCPVKPGKDLTAHIPQEVLDVSYGCGSPVEDASITEGSTVVDLGCGAGIDCFIAAKLVGDGGAVIGVDMTDEMLDLAKGAAPIVAENLDFDVVEFRKGFLEDLPLEDSVADLALSNCVINLSHDKLRVLSELWRVLREGGRFCISDVVSETDIPEHMVRDKKLWGECISGALTASGFLACAREAGFTGLTLSSMAPYREVDGLRFFSVTIKGYKSAKSREDEELVPVIYLGPFKSVTDDDGRLYPAGIAVEVARSVASKLLLPSYAGLFEVGGRREGGGAPDRSSSDLKGGCCS